MDESCPEMQKVIRACDSKSWDAWKEVQAKEFLFYAKQKMRSNIQKRQHQRLTNMEDAAAVPAQSASAAAATTTESSAGSAYNPVIVITESDTEESSADSPASTPKLIKRKRTIRVQVPVASTTPTPSAATATPSTLLRLLRQIQTSDDPSLDPPECECSECPFCTGALMEQRFCLARRLVQIENSLYGKHGKIRKL